MDSSQYKASSNGGYVEGGGGGAPAVANKRKMRGTDVVLRFLALALSLVAAVVLGVNKETKTVAVTLPPVNVPVTAKAHYLSAFVFLVAADSIACAYAAISLLLALANMGAKKGVSLFVILSDLIMVALLFSGIGAALAIGLIGYIGNSHLQWKEVCSVFDKFCGQAVAAVVLSGAAALEFLVLVVIAAFNLHKKN